MKTNDILEVPVISEKMSALSERYNRYGIKDDRKANKIQIKKAVEDIYGVKVDSVKTMIVRGKTRKRFTKSKVIEGKKKSYKKAIVTLVKGDTIDFFSNV